VRRPRADCAGPEPRIRNRERGTRRGVRGAVALLGGLWLVVASAGATRAEAPRAPGAAPRAGAGAVTLSIVSTSDLHGHIESLPMLAGHLSNLREKRRRDGGAVVLVDAGDMFQGTLESNLGEGRAVIRAYNHLGYDAAAIGNHELDYGPEGPATTAEAGQDPRGALKARAAEARFPFLAANLHEAGAARPVSWTNVKPSHMVVAAGCPVGIVGVTTLSTQRGTIAANFAGLALAPLAEAIAREARGLRERGAAVVIAVAHAGGRCRDLSAPEDLSSCESSSELFEVARALPRGLVDVLVGGHTHGGVAHRVARIPVVEAFSGGVAFGRVDLQVEGCAEGGEPGSRPAPRARRAVKSARIHPPRHLCRTRRGVLVPARLSGPADLACPADDYEGLPVAPDAALVELLRPAFDEARARRFEPLGVTVSTAVRRVRAEEGPLGNLIADLMRAARPGADVALTNSGGVRADFGPGPLTYGELYETLPFDNAYATLTMTGRDLADVIARNLTSDVGILSVSGLRATARCDGPRLRVDLRRDDGRAIAPDEVLTVATNDFLATGGDQLLSGARAKIVAGFPIRELLAHLLRRRGGELRGDDPKIFDPRNPRLVYPGRRPMKCP
jgi:5'-nucleotidase